MAFETISSEIRYQGRAFDVRQDQVRMPDGRVVPLDIVDHTGAVTLVPVDESGRIWFVRQYRHAVGRELLELPAGTLDEGELPETCARREAREEIGMTANKLQKIGEFFLAPGYSTEYMHVYLARDMHPDPLPGDQDEFLSVEVLQVERVFELIAAGEIQDAKSLLAIFLARPYLTPDEHSG